MSKSAIFREFRRNNGRSGWHPKQAQEFRDGRRKKCANVQRLSIPEWMEVERLVRLDMSLEQAARRLALEGGLQINHGTIYLYIYADKRRGGRSMAAFALSEAAQEALRERARTIEAHWSHLPSGSRATSWQPKAQQTYAGRDGGSNAAAAPPHKGKCHTMTFDNGKEFTEHETIAAELNADVYFVRPYHSWEAWLE